MLPRLCLLIGAASAVLGMVVQPVHKLPTAGIAMHHQPQPLLSTPMVQPLLTPSSVVADEPRFRVLPSGEVMALEGENPAEKGKAAEPTATPEHSAAAKAGEHEKCTEGKEYSKIFKKCLPRVGTDGYTPSADASASAAGDKKGKLIGDSRVFQDPDQVAALHEQPIIRNAALTAGQQAPGQQAPGQQAPGQQQPGQQQLAQQLRLACPSGFVYQPNMGTCIAFRPTSALAVRGRDGDNDDDGNDDNDDDRRGAMTERGGDEDRRSRLFGRSGRFMFHHRDESPFFHGRRRFGFGPRSFRPRFMGSFRGESPSILAPVFVFVLPPMKLDREGKQRIHHIHPSFVGPADKKADATVIPKGKEMETKPAQPPITPEAPTKVEDKGKAVPAAPATTKPSEPSTPTTPPAKPIESKPTVVPAALRQAEFINPIVGGGDMSTATSMAAPTSDEQPAKLSERVSSDQML